MQENGPAFKKRFPRHAWRRVFASKINSANTSFAYSAGVTLKCSSHCILFFRLFLTVILILILVNIANVTKLRMQFVQTKIYYIYSIAYDVYFIIKRSGPQLTRRKKTTLDLKRTYYPKLETEMPLTRAWSNLYAKTEALSTLRWINAYNQLILWVNHLQA